MDTHDVNTYATPPSEGVLDIRVNFSKRSKTANQPAVSSLSPHEELLYLKTRPDPDPNAGRFVMQFTERSVLPQPVGKTKASERTRRYAASRKVPWARKRRNDASSMQVLTRLLGRTYVRIPQQPRA